jgi:3-deoxy-D-arabino-heptulosonate 7-phosphate (DAHP) synthase class II
MKTVVEHVLENTVGPKVGPNLTLSQIVASLIERWDSMNDEEKLAVQLCIDGEAVVESIVAVAPDPA